MPEECCVDTKSILIVDDDDSVCSSLASILRSALVEIKTAYAIEEAEMLLKNQRFDLAIIDLRLGGSDGLEGLDLISNIKAWAPEMRIALFTAYCSPEIEIAARERGAEGFWEKTIKIDIMIERIKTLGILAGVRIG